MEPQLKRGLPHGQNDCHCNQWWLESSGKRPAAQPQGVVCPDRQYVRVHRVFHGLDDVRRDRDSDQEDAEPELDPVWLAHGDARADGVSGAGAPGYLDRQIRWPHRHDRVDGTDRSCDLDDGLCDRVLAFPRRRPVCGAGGRRILGRHALCGAVVSQESAGHGDGRVRRGQLRRCGQQVCRTGDSGGLWLGRRAACVRGHHAGRGDSVLDVQLQRSVALGVQQRQILRTDQGPQGSQGAQVLSVLQHRLRWLCGAVAVDGSVLRG